MLDPTLRAMLLGQMETMLTPVYNREDFDPVGVAEDVSALKWATDGVGAECCVFLTDR